MQNLKNVLYNDMETFQSLLNTFLFLLIFHLLFGPQLYISNHELYLHISQAMEKQDIDLYHYNYEMNICLIIISILMLIIHLLTID